MTQKIYVGRVVHFVSLPIGGQIDSGNRALQAAEIPHLRHHAAQIVYVSHDNRCNLAIVDEYGNHYFREEVPYSAEGLPGTWHEIEDEAEPNSLPQAPGDR